MVIVVIVRFLAVRQTISLPEKPNSHADPAEQGCKAISCKRLTRKLSSALAACKGRAARLKDPPCLQGLLVGDGGSCPVELGEGDGELLVECLRLVLQEADRRRLP